MKPSRYVLCLVLASVSASAFAADPNVFTIVNKDGKAVGKASYTISKAKQGSRVVSRFEYHLSSKDVPAPPADPVTDTKRGGVPVGGLIEGQYTSDYKVDDNGNYLSGYTEDMALLAINGFQPSKDGKALEISASQAGHADTHLMDVARPDYLVAPNFDPSVLQVLVSGALAHPHADSTYMLIVPSTSLRAAPQAVYVTLQMTPQTMRGTLDGKSIAVKMYLLNYHDSRAELFTDENGTLLEAAMAPLHVNYIRAKFVLTVPAS